MMIMKKIKKTKKTMRMVSGCNVRMTRRRCLKCERCDNEKVEIMNIVYKPVWPLMVKWLEQVSQ